MFLGQDKREQEEPTELELEIADREQKASLGVEFDANGEEIKFTENKDLVLGGNGIDPQAHKDFLDRLLSGDNKQKMAVELNRIANEIASLEGQRGKLSAKGLEL